MSSSLRFALACEFFGWVRPALKSGQVARNVAILVDAPARVDHEISPLTVDQVATFLDAIEGDRLRALYVAAIGTGLRQGELLGLRWADVDLDAATLAVRHTLQRFSTRTLAEPKTERSSPDPQPSGRGARRPA